MSMNIPTAKAKVPSGIQKIAELHDQLAEAYYAAANEEVLLAYPSVDMVHDFVAEHRKQHMTANKFRLRYSVPAPV